MIRRQMSVADQVARTRELDRIRTTRRLTAEEQAEADNLMDRAYQREWRRMLAEGAPPRRPGHRHGGPRP